jgi:pilus assembly protein CpaB
MTPVRRRGLLLLCFALVCGGLAASQVRERERRAEAAVGPLVAVLVAKRDLPAERRLRPGDVAVKRLPARFAPPDVLAPPVPLAGARTAVALAEGGYVTEGAIRGAARDSRGGLRPRQRALELPVGGGSALAGAGPGSRVDVVISTQRHDGAGRTFVALEDVELLALHPTGAVDSGPESGAAGASPGSAAATALATLRVSVRQAVYLTAAANFAHEIRLLLRPPGDRERTGAPAVTQGRL